MSMGTIPGGSSVPGICSLGDGARAAAAIVDAVLVLELSDDGNCPASDWRCTPDDPRRRASEKRWRSDGGCGGNGGSSCGGGGDAAGLMIVGCCCWTTAR